MREFTLINQAIDKFKLELSGLTVVTEAASGNYSWLPIIAAKAGASVVAIGRDSSYGSFSEVKRRIDSLATELEVSKQISVTSSFDSSVTEKADIITNSGFLRPLSAEKLQDCKSTLVIPLMYETWEYRNADLDLSYCEKNDILVLGTNESDSRLKTIDYLSAVAKKLMFEAQIEVFQSKVLLLGEGKFFDVVRTGLENEKSRVYYQLEKSTLNELDAIIIADHESDRTYLDGVNGPTLQDISSSSSNLTLIHISGKVDREAIERLKINCHPKKIAAPKYMSVTTDYVGPKPVIDLHTAGLKVGEEMSRARLSGLELVSARKKALANSICQPFAQEQLS